MNNKNSLIMYFRLNYNNKLNNDYFTSIRMTHRYNDHRHLLVSYNGLFKVVEIVEVRKVLVHKLNDWITYLDAGMGKSDFIDYCMNSFKYDFTKVDASCYIYLLKSLTPLITHTEAVQFGIVNDLSFS